MNPTSTQPIEESAESQPRSPREYIKARISEAKLPQATKKLATKLLERCLRPGDPLCIKFDVLRRLCHQVNNIEVVKHLRRMQSANLITYETDWQTMQVVVRFVVE